MGKALLSAHCSRKQMHGAQSLPCGPTRNPAGNHHRPQNVVRNRTPRNHLYGHGPFVQMEVEGKTVLDMGCGTGILGILASKLGAAEVTGIDIDSWCTTNSAENCELNAVSKMQLKLGDASLLQKEGQFDLILANINKNILLADLPQYVKNMRPGSTLIMSGFYQNDLRDIDALAQKHQLRLKKTLENNQWAAVAYVLEAAI